MPYTPEQNGSAERENRTLVKASHPMLHSKEDLTRKLWADTVNTATYIINRTGLYYQVRYRNTLLTVVWGKTFPLIT